MNLTDNEIIKKFKEFIEYSRYNVGRKSTELLENILALIECKDVAIEILKKDIDYQNAEIERWRANYTLPKEGFFNVLCGALVYTKTLEEYNQFRRTINAEAIKEFAERLRRTISISDAQKVYFNNLVKEMVGEIINENQISS